MSAGRLAGRAALITGGGGGIGTAIALRFAGEGAAVALVDLDRAAAERAAAAVAAAGGTAVALSGDVGADAEAAALVSDALAALGRIDVLVNNAARFPPEVPITGITPEEFALAVATNIGGAFHMSRHVLPHMVARRSGVIIHLASQLGTVGKKGQALYCATKGALVSLAQAMALDHAGDGIRVVSLSPGGVATAGMAEKWGSMDEAERQWGRPKHPLGRLARVEEVAGAALFLAGDDASFVTGTDLLVDGGYTAQ